jgi:hypothetical protein
MAESKLGRQAIPPFSQQKPDTWITLLGRPLRWNSPLPYEQGEWFLSQQIMEASYLLPKNIQDMTPDPLGYVANNSI